MHVCAGKAAPVPPSDDFYSTPVLASSGSFTGKGHDELIGEQLRAAPRHPFDVGDSPRFTASQS